MKQNEIQDIIKGYGIDLCGIADLSPALEQLVDQGGPIFEKYPNISRVPFACR